MSRRSDQKESELISEINFSDGPKVSHKQANSIADLLFETWGSPETSVAKITDNVLNKWKDWVEASENNSPKTYVMWKESTCLAHAWLRPVKAFTQKGEITVAELGAVCVRETLRGKGLGTKLIKRVFDDVDQSSYQFCIFSTENRVQAFYERLGARKVTNRFIDSITEKSPFWGEIMMVYPRTGDWSEGEIDMRGFKLGY